MAKDPEQYITKTAINMLQKGRDIKMVMQVTGLSLAEIQKLKAIL